MNKIKKTPAMDAVGAFKVGDPWVVDQSQLWKVIAIRNYNDLLEKNVDVIHAYYEPVGLGEAEYKEDYALGANLVTLYNEYLGTVEIPDTYILEYPNQDAVNYGHVVLTVSLSAVPDNLNYAFLQEQMAGVVSDVIGVSPKVEYVLVPTTGVITQEEHGRLEAARLAAINNRTTDRARLLSLQAAYDRLQANYAILEQYIIDHGLNG